MNEIKNDPMALLFGMFTEQAMEATSRITELVNKYKANNIDVIPISEIEDCMKKGVEKATGEDSFMSKMLKNSNLNI